MVCSDKTLFVLAVTMCSKDGVNCVSSNRSFSNADFYRLASTSDFGAFVDVCAERLMANHMEHEFLERVCSDLSCVLTEDDLNSVSHDWVIAESARGQLHELKRASDGLVSPFDDDFPLLNKNVVKGSEKPFLLSYKGDLSLLGGINQNVAVIGLVNPDDSIAEREVRVVEAFVERGQAIVSGPTRSPTRRACGCMARQLRFFLRLLRASCLLKIARLQMILWKTEGCWSRNTI